MRYYIIANSHKLNNELINKLDFDENDSIILMNLAYPFQFDKIKNHRNKILLARLDSIVSCLNNGICPYIKLDGQHHYNGLKYFIDYEPEPFTPYMTFKNVNLGNACGVTDFYTLKNFREAYYMADTSWVPNYEEEFKVIFNENSHLLPIYHATKNIKKTGENFMKKNGVWPTLGWFGYQISKFRCKAEDKIYMIGFDGTKEYQNRRKDEFIAGKVHHLEKEYKEFMMDDQVVFLTSDDLEEL